MRIGVDATCWWNTRGFGRFTRELLKAMFDQPATHEYCVFVDRSPPAEMERPNVRIVQIKTSRPVTEAAVANDYRSLRDLWAFSRVAAKQSLDVMFFPAVYSWFPVFPRLSTVVTFHDAIAERFPELVFPDFRGRLRWRLKVRAALWQATRVMTVSDAAKDEIVDHLGIRPQRIDVVGEAAGARFRPISDGSARRPVRDRYDLPDDVPLILYVGGLAPHKNLVGLLHGFSLALSDGDLGDTRLVLVGPRTDGFHSNESALRDQIRDDPELSGRVHFIGFVPDDDLAVLYSTATCLALPSFSEGFGLPAIEALACGTPVLASHSGSLPEVVGEAGVYFDPRDVREIASAIQRLIGDPELQRRLGKAALQRAAHFSWAQSAQRALACLERCGKAS